MVMEMLVSLSMIGGIRSRDGSWGVSRSWKSDSDIWLWEGMIWMRGFWSRVVKRMTCHCSHWQSYEGTKWGQLTENFVFSDMVFRLWKFSIQLTIKSLSKYLLPALSSSKYLPRAVVFLQFFPLWFIFLSFWKSTFLDCKRETFIFVFGWSLPPLHEKSGSGPDICPLLV